MNGRRSLTRNLRKARGGSPRGSGRSRRRLRYGTLALGLTLGVVTPLLAVPAAWQFCRTHPYFALREVEISGHARLTRQEVLETAGLSPGSSVWDAAPRTVTLRLRRHAWIASARVQRRFPNFLRIEIRERKPVAVARLHGLYYIDEEGRLLGTLRDGDSPDFPLVTGLEAEAAGTFSTIALRRAILVLRSCVDAGWVDSLSEIHVDRRRGVTVFPLRTPVPVVLGWGRWEEKLARAARAMTAWEGREQEVLEVDASFGDLVVVRLRQEGKRAAPGGQGKGIQV